MPLSVKCSCGAAREVDSDWAGLSTRCRQCGAWNRVAADAPPSADAMPEAVAAPEAVLPAAPRRISWRIVLLLALAAAACSAAACLIFR